jgi:hypothetical protein
MELCSLNPPLRETTGRSVHRQARSMRVAHAETAAVKIGAIKGMQAKGKPAKVAHAVTTTIRQSDIHAIP